MKITEVKVFPVAEPKLKAFVSIVIDGCFMINDIKIIQGRDGLFISMPSRRKKNGKFKDVAHPLNNETRKSIETLVLDEYVRTIETQAPGEGDPPAAVAETSSPVAGGDVAGATPPDEQPRNQEAAEDKSVDEVAEIHLRDSYWTS